jgi:predicted nuclease of restriction endonuclease-like (RecB) superfamily
VAAKRKSPRIGAVAATPPSAVGDALFSRVVEIIEAARGQVARSVNSAMVHAYWRVGREIVEVEQQGESRAGYGERVLEALSTRLTARLGKGYSAPNLRNMRQFFLTFPAGSALPAEFGGPAIRSGLPSKSSSTRIRSAAPSKSTLVQTAPFPPHLGWTHYAILMRIATPTARAFYEIEAVREGWSSRELERQIASLLFERLAKSRDKEKVLALARRGQHVAAPEDVLKDPFVLEFLGLDERAHWRERDLEQAIIDRIGDFLLEMGKGFCFVARQKRLTLEGDHFYVDLVFYNRLLRCFVLVDLKLGKLTHQDLGQMQMYVNFFDRFQRAEHEAKTIGIVLCSEKNDAMAKITLPEDNAQIVATRYQMYLPTEEELRAELAKERGEAERVLRLATDDAR